MIRLPFIWLFLLITHRTESWFQIILLKNIIFTQSFCFAATFLIVLLFSPFVSCWKPPVNMTHFSYHCLKKPVLVICIVINICCQAEVTWLSSVVCWKWEESDNRWPYLHIFNHFQYAYSQYTLCICSISLDTYSVFQTRAYFAITARRWSKRAGREIAWPIKLNNTSLVSLIIRYQLMILNPNDIIWYI